MKNYCITCKKDTGNKNPKVFKTKNGRMILKSICSVCSIKKSRFISKDERSGLNTNKENSDIINRFLLRCDKFVPEMHLWDIKVKKYSACSPFTKYQQGIDQFMKDGKFKNIIKNKLDAACFQHDSAYANFKDFLNRKKSDIVLKNKPYKLFLMKEREDQE